MTAPVLDLPGLHASPVRVLAACLDGTLWVQLPAGGVVNVDAFHIADLTNPPRRENAYNLTDGQIEVLRAFGRAHDDYSTGRRPEDGLADFEHPGAQSTVAEHRRVLISRGLVMKRHGVERTNATYGHVWAITHAGRQALKPPCPTTVGAGAA